jgi:6-phosphogluconate dehydrogenase
MTAKYVCILRSKLCLEIHSVFDKEGQLKFLNYDNQFLFKILFTNIFQNVRQSF